MISALEKLYPWRYLVAIVVTGLTYLLRAGLQPILGERGRVVLFTLAVTLSAMNGGFGPGLLATALSVILAAFAIFEPRGFMALTDSGNLVTLGLFGLVGFALSALAEELHKTRRGLTEAHDRAHEQNLRLSDEIAQRRQIESALRESENKLRRLTNAIPGAVYQFELRPDGRQRFLSVSDGIVDLIGQPAGAVVEDFSLLWDAVLAEDKADLENSILRSAQQLTPWDFEGRVQLADRSIKWIRGHLVPEARRADGSIVWNGILTDVSERKRNDFEIARLAAIVENSGDAIISRGFDLRVLSWNAAAERMFGYRAEEAIGRVIDFIVPEELRPEVEQRRASLMRGELPPSWDAVRLARGGKRIDVSITQSPILDDKGHLIAVSLTIRDIGERKRAEQALRVGAHSIRRLYEIANAANVSFDTRIHELLRHACDRLGVANGAVTRRVQDAVELIYVHSPAGELVESARVPLRDAYCTVAFDADEPIGIEHVGRSEMNRHPGYRTLGLECYFGTRIMVNDEVFGALCFVAKEPLSGSFNEADRDFIKLLSAWIGTELARRQAEDDLQKSHDNIRQIIDTDPNFIFAKDREGRFTLVNKALATAYGATSEQLIGKTDADINSETEGVAQFRKIDLEVMDTLQERFTAEEKFTDANGQTWWFQSIKRPIVNDDGRPTQVLGVATDITARKLAEEALRRSEQHLVTAQSIAHLGSWEWDFQTGRNSWSDESYRLFGYAPGSVAPNYDNWVKRVHPDDRLRVQEQLHLAFDGTASCDIEFRVVYPTGDVRHVHWRGEVERDMGGNELRMAGTVLDITERKRIEEALRHAHDELERRVEERTLELQRMVAHLTKTESLLQQAVDVANLGVFERDHLTGEGYYTPTLCQILDLPGDYHDGVGGFAARIHPDDRERVDSARQRAHHPSGPGQLSLEHRVQRADGSIGWVMNRAQTFFAGSGDARRHTRTIGVVLDITERKRAEDALRTSEERLQHALAVGRMGTWARDLRTGESQWDDRIREMCGIGVNEAIGRNRFIAHVHPADLAVLQEASWKSEVDGQDGECEFRFVRPDGKMIWILTHFGPRRDAQGVVTHIDGINYDITERKAAEESMRKLNQQLDRRVAERTQDLAESRAGLRALVAQLTMTEERERRRLAVELHDTLAQSLAVVNIYLWRARELMGEQAHGASMADVLASLDRTVDESVKYTRSLIAELSPPVLYDLGLPAAFAWLGEQMGGHGLHVQIDGPTEDFAPAQSDAVFLFQCARELLWNVVKHGATDSATLAYGRDGTALSLAVTDQGKGFDQTSARANGDGGSHFGLFSIRERVALRGGTVEISAAPGIGTWVSIMIPMEAHDRVAAKPVAPAIRSGARASVDDDAIKILIVDDHKMLRQGLRRALEEQTGFAVVGEAGDGAEAVALALHIEPQVVIMDVNMPTMNGVEATREIVRQLPSTIVIGVSFGIDDFVLRAMREAGAVICLPKERAVEDVSQAIWDALGGRQVGEMDSGDMENGELKTLD